MKVLRQRCRFVSFGGAIVAAMGFLHHARSSKKNCGSNLPEINHSRQNFISYPIISLAQIFFRASILASHKEN